MGPKNSSQSGTNKSGKAGGISKVVRHRLQKLADLTEAQIQRYARKTAQQARDLAARGHATLRMWRVCRATDPMEGNVGEVVSFPLTLLDDHDLLLSLARFADQLETEAAIRKRFNFDESTWQALGENDALCAKVEALKRSRIASGASARERAQVVYAGVPLKLGEIINSPASSPRFVIEASREIRAQAAVGPDAPPAADRISIVINLGSDTEYFNKTRAVGVDDPAGDSDAGIDRITVAVLAKKSTEGTGGHDNNL